MCTWLSAILAIALVVGGIVWYATSRNDLETKTVEFQEDLGYYRSQIQKICTFTPTSTPATKEECDEVLEDFADMLTDYRATLEEYPATTTVPMPTSTTPGASTTTN